MSFVAPYVSIHQLWTMRETYHKFRLFDASRSRSAWRIRVLSKLFEAVFNMLYMVYPALTLKILLSSIASYSKLPVKGLRMHCSICSHGGHMKCYRAYYKARPAVEIDLGPDRDANTKSSRARQGSFFGDSFERERRKVVMGQECVTGCGHICFVAPSRVQDSET